MDFPYFLTFLFLITVVVERIQGNAEKSLPPNTLSGKELRVAFTEVTYMLDLTNMHETIYWFIDIIILCIIRQSFIFLFCADRFGSTNISKFYWTRYWVRGYILGAIELACSSIKFQVFIIILICRYVCVI